MPRKGPAKKIARITTISFYPEQFKWLQLERIRLGLPSMADLVRNLVNEAIKEGAERKEK